MTTPQQGANINGLYDVIKHGFFGVMRSAHSQQVQDMLKSVEENGYRLTPSSSQSFVQFDRPDKLPRETGWKFHMSIDPNDTARATEIVMEELSKRNHQGSFKVATEKTNVEFSNPNSDQAGKTFTIYADGNPARMAATIEAIEARLKEESIRPGPRVVGDRAVPGSSYSSYRNDKDDMGRYVADKTNYNVGNHPDPFAGMLAATYTNKGPMVPVDRMSPAELSAFKASLDDRGIAYTQRPSSINDGKDVVHVAPDSTEKFMDFHRDSKISTPDTMPAARNAAATADAARPSAGTNGIGVAGAHVDRNLGRAGVGVEAAAALSRGDVGGAAMAVAEYKAVEKGVSLVGKRIPGIGAFVTAGFTLYAAGSQAWDGNYGMALSELGAGTAETVGNIVGFGAGDALREVFREAVGAVAGDEYKPEMSGLRQMAETAYDLGKSMLADDVADMDSAALAQVIQNDPTLPDTVEINGREMALADAIQDPSFRRGMIDNMHAAEAKGYELAPQIAMLETYDQKIRQEQSMAAASPEIDPSYRQQQPVMAVPAMG